MFYRRFFSTRERRGVDQRQTIVRWADVEKAALQKPSSPAHFLPTIESLSFQSLSFSAPSLVFLSLQQWHNGRIIVTSCDAAGIMTTLPMKEWTEDDDDDNGCWTIHDQSKVEEDI